MRRRVRVAGARSVRWTGTGRWEEVEGGKRVGVDGWEEGGRDVERVERWRGGEVERWRWEGEGEGSREEEDGDEREREKFVE